MLDVDVVSAERRCYQGEAAEVYARSIEGEIGILPGHEPTLLALDVAPLRVKLADGEEVVIAVHGGVLEVGDDRLTVLAEVAERAEEIDVPRAESALERARTRIASDEPQVRAQGEREQARALVRLRCARGEVAQPQ